MQRGLRGVSPAAAFDKARVNLPGKIETIWQPLYDYQTRTAAANTVQRFFADPVGQNGKTLSDTNLELSGQIPKGQAFIITGIQVELYPGVAINDASETSAFADDIYDFYNNGHLVLNIGSKSYATQGNLLKFAPVNRMAMETSVTGTASRFAYATAAGREFAVRDLLLESNQNFNVELRETAAISADARVGITLNGYLMRNAQ